MAEITSTNPYAAPKAAVADIDSGGDTQAVRWWNPSGRMGRLHYIGYSIGASLLLGFVITALGAALGAAGAAFAVPLIAVVGYIAYFVLFFQLTVQRCHDFNSSGWWSVLAIVPLVNFAFWFIPGSKGANRWGASPARSGGAWIVVVLVLAVFLIGIVAAVAIPAYSDYTKRARAAQMK